MQFKVLKKSKNNEHMVGISSQRSDLYAKIRDLQIEAREDRRRGDPRSMKAMEEKLHRIGDMQ